MACTECGLRSSIAALRSQDPGPPWFSERSALDEDLFLLRLPGRFPRTWFHAIWPHHFWRAIELRIPIRTRRLVVYLAFVALLTHIVAALVRTADVLALASTAGIDPLDLTALIAGAWIAPFMNARSGYTLPSLLGPHIVVFILATLTPALAVGTLTMLPSTLRRAKIRPAHLVRAAVYGTTPVPLYFAIIAIGIRMGNAAGALATLALLLVTMLLSLDAVTRHYLRVPHAAAVAVLHTVLSVLVVAATIAGVAILVR